LPVRKETWNMEGPLSSWRKDETGCDNQNNSARVK
jgi:hypothetical protein